MGRLAELIEAKWGFHVRPEFTPATVAITAAEKQILKQNPDRVLILAINLGSEVCYLHTSREVSSDLGIYLDKLGGGIEMPWDIYGELIGLEWWCEGAGDTNLYLVSLVGV